MGQAKRRKEASAAGNPWPQDTSFRGDIELHTLPPVDSITTDRIMDLSGDRSLPPGKQVNLTVYRAVVGDRTFHVGFCLGDGERFSAIGLAVIERLGLEAPEAPLHVVPIIDKEIAWDVVLRHLRTFTGEVLLFAFSNSTVYDAGTAEVQYSKEISIFTDGVRWNRLTEDDRRKVKAQAAAMMGEAPPPTWSSLGSSR